MREQGTNPLQFMCMYVRVGNMTFRIPWKTNRLFCDDYKHFGPNLKSEHTAMAHIESPTNISGVQWPSV